MSEKSHIDEENHEDLSFTSDSDGEKTPRSISQPKGTSSPISSNFTLVTMPQLISTDVSHHVPESAVDASAPLMEDPHTSFLSPPQDAPPESEQQTFEAVEDPPDTDEAEDPKSGELSRRASHDAVAISVRSRTPSKEESNRSCSIPASGEGKSATAPVASTSVRRSASSQLSASFSPLVDAGLPSATAEEKSSVCALSAASVSSPKCEVSENQDCKKLSDVPSPLGHKKKKESLYYVFVHRFTLVNTAEDMHQWASRAKHQWGGGEDESGDGVAIQVSSHSVVRGSVPIKKLQFSAAWSGVTWGQDKGIPIPLQDDSLLIVEVITTLSPAWGSSSAESSRPPRQRVLAMSLVNAQSILEEERQWGKFCVHFLPHQYAADVLVVHAAAEITVVAGSCVEEEMSQKANHLSRKVPSPFYLDPSSAMQKRTNHEDTPEDKNTEVSSSSSTLLPEACESQSSRMTDTKEPLVAIPSSECSDEKETPSKAVNSANDKRKRTQRSRQTPAFMVFAFNSSSAGSRWGGDVGFTTLEYNYGCVRVSTVDFFFPSFFLSGCGQYIVTNVLCAMNMTESSALAMQLVPLKDACAYLQTSPSSVITVRPQERAFFTATWRLKKKKYFGASKLGLELLVYGSHKPTARILLQVHHTAPHNLPNDVPFMYWANHTCFYNRQMMSMDELSILKDVLPVYQIVSSATKKAARSRKGSGVSRSRGDGNGARLQYGRQPLLPPPPSSTHVLGSSSVPPPLLSSSASLLSSSALGPYSVYSKDSSAVIYPTSPLPPPLHSIEKSLQGGERFGMFDDEECLIDTNASFVLSKTLNEVVLDLDVERSKLAGGAHHVGHTEEKGGAAETMGGSEPHAEPFSRHRRLFYRGPLLSIQQRTCRCAITLGPIRGFPFLESASGQPHAFRIAITLLDKVGWKVLVGETKPSYPTASGSLQWNETLYLQKWPCAIASQFCRLHLSEVRSTDGDETPIGAGLISLGDFNKIHEFVPLCVALSVYDTYSQYDQMISPSLLMKDISFRFFDVR